MSLAGLHVAAFESRRGSEMERLIARHGGTPHVSPSMQEVPLEENRQAIDFAHRLITAEVDAVILLTGVGTETLAQIVERHIDKNRFLTALADTTTIARGPKSVAALKTLGIQPTYRVESPHTWREILQLIDTHLPLAGQCVGVQEYGISNPSLIAGLEARGAHVLPIPVYRWELPDDTGPLENNICDIISGKIDVALFTSANQVNNLLSLAEKMGQVDALRNAMQRVVVASIGPTTSDYLRERQLVVDLEAEVHKMGQLVSITKEQAVAVKDRKKKLSSVLSAAAQVRDNESQNTPWKNSLLLRACRR